MVIAVCDDNLQDLSAFSQGIRRLAEKHRITVDVLPYVSGKQLLFDYDSKKIADIVFLAVEMAEQSGLQTAGELRGQRFAGELILVAQSDRFVLEAFDVNALHYIVKGVTAADKIEEIFLRAVKSMSEKQEECILFTSAGEFRNVPIRRIKYFETYKKIITVYYDDEAFEFYSASLERVEEQLAGYDMLRAHRSYLVARSQVAALSYEWVTLLDGKKIPVGRKYYPELKQALTVQ